MAEFDRKAGVLWTGDLKGGKGLISTESRVLYELPYSYDTRFGDKTGLNPEELIAAAHAACFSMAVTSTLVKNNLKPEQVETNATCTLQVGEGGPKITKMTLHVRCEVPGIDEAKLKKLVMEADKGCPVSNLLRNGAKIEITTDLI